MAAFLLSEAEAFIYHDYLLQNSDEEHPVTIKQIVEYLGAQGISAERKSIYDDIEALRFYGLDIIHVDARPVPGLLCCTAEFRAT